MSNLVTDAEAKQMTERCDKATPGEWVTELLQHDVEISAITPKGEMSVAWVHLGHHASTSERNDGIQDADFLAHARTDMPRLLSERERLLAIVRGLLEKAENIRHWHDTMPDKETGETVGMIVSAKSVRELWEAKAKAREYMAEVTK